jgi:NAD(P)-dependent dehydrogenase (short-subunit alcohol dehydrogenase family)
MEAHGGAIVNMSADMWGGMPGMAHSGAARAGMVNFTESAACEWAASGVRVNAVAPGWIASSGIETYPPEVQEMGEDAQAARFPCSASAPSRKQRRHRLPALARRLLHHRRHAGASTAACRSHADLAARRPQALEGLQRLPAAYAPPKF